MGSVDLPPPALLVLVRRLKGIMRHVESSFPVVLAQLVFERLESVGLLLPLLILLVHVQY